MKSRFRIQSWYFGAQLAVACTAFACGGGGGSAPMTMRDGGIAGDDAGADAGTPTAPRETLLVELEYTSFGIEADETHVYYSSGGGVARVPVEGGTPETLYDGDGVVRKLAIGANHVAFVEDMAFAEVPTLVLRAMRKDGSGLVELESSEDTRSFLSFTIADEEVVYTDAFWLRSVPVTGGDPTFLGESSNGSSHWLYSPVVLPDGYYFAEWLQLHFIPRGSHSARATSFAALPGWAYIVGPTDGELVAVHWDILSDSFAGPSGVAIIDAEGATTKAFTFEAEEITELQHAFALRGDEVWIVSGQSLRSVSLIDGTVERVREGLHRAVTANESAVFVSDETGIVRITP